MLLTKIKDRFVPRLSLYTIVVLILVAVLFRIVGVVFSNLRTQNVNIGVEADLFSWIAYPRFVIGLGARRHENKIVAGNCRRRRWRCHRDHHPCRAIGR